MREEFRRRDRPQLLLFLLLYIPAAVFASRKSSVPTSWSNIQMLSYSCGQSLMVSKSVLYSQSPSSTQLSDKKNENKILIQSIMD